MKINATSRFLSACFNGASVSTVALCVFGVIGVIGTAAVTSTPAAAQAAYESSSNMDPPGRVGRVSEITGQVWTYSPGSGEWVAAVRNRPLTSGDRLSTDGGARAEIRIGSTTLRIDSGSELEVLQLDDNLMALQLHSGSTSVRLRQRESAGEFELRTSEGRFSVQRTGRYRFERRDDTSQVTVYSGQAYFEGQRSALAVSAGQRAEFWLDARNAAQYAITEPVRDAFAAYNNERDQRDDRSASARYVSPEMTGMEDLDRHGRWEQNADYGPLWIPRTVAPGWAPYAAGHWAFVRPWGWTWIDDAPWGFAPFHYGRWVYLRDTWGWAPGTFVARPVYAPALVAWVGGPRLSVGISIGGGASGGGGNFGASVGWFPLAPREVYVPSYRVSPRYVQQVNITQVTNITNITTIVNNPQVAVRDMDFANRKFHHAVTTVPEAVMTGQGNVATAAAQWRAANPGGLGGLGGRGGVAGEDRIERGGRRNDPGRNAVASPPVMTMAAAPVPSPNLTTSVNTSGVPSPARNPTPTMSGPAAPSMMSRPSVRANDEPVPAQRMPVERQLGARERAGDGDRPNRVVPLPNPPAAMSGPATLPTVPTVPTAPMVSARPAQGRMLEPPQRNEPRNESRNVPQAAVSPVAAPPAAAAPANPSASPRMEGPRTPAREAASGEGRKQSQDEKSDGRRNNNAPRAVE